MNISRFPSAIKLGILLGIISLSTQQALAQKESALTGTWAVQYEDYDGSAVYEFRTEGSAVVGYCIKLTEEDGQAHAVNEKLVTGLKFNGQSGKADYKYEYDEGQSVTVPCTLSRKSATVLELTYSYMGYSGTETWRKL